MRAAAERARDSPAAGVGRPRRARMMYTPRGIAHRAGQGLTTAQNTPLYSVPQREGGAHKRCWGGQTPGKGHGYEFNVALIAMALSIVVGGAGAFSVDRMLVPWGD